MSFFDGNRSNGGAVALSKPTGHDLVLLADDLVRRHIAGWLARAESSADILYFEVLEGEQPVGQIFLHDIDRRPGEADVGYHLLREEHRGRGLGTQALTLLVDYVRAETALQRLEIMTGSTNAASRRVAEKCGFVHFRTHPRPEREDGADLVYFQLALVE